MEKSSKRKKTKTQIERDWLTRQQNALVRKEMVKLGEKKYGLDQKTARRWAQLVTS